MADYDRVPGAGPAVDGADSWEETPQLRRQFSLKVYERPSASSQLYKLTCITVAFSPIIMILTVSLPGGMAYYWTDLKSRKNETDCKRFSLISHMGTYAPASCFFTLFLTLGAFLLTLVVTMLHRICFFKEVDNKQENRRCTAVICFMNDIALVLGYAASMGLLFIGAFQTSELKYWHQAGLFLFVIPGFMFTILVSVIMGAQREVSRAPQLKPSYIMGIFLIAFRVVIIVVTAVTFILFGYWMMKAFSKWDGDVEEKKSKWCPVHSGFEEYELAAKYELAFVVAFLLFVLTLQWEFCVYFSAKSVLTCFKPRIDVDGGLTVSPSM